MKQILSTLRIRLSLIKKIKSVPLFFRLLAIIIFCFLFFSTLEKSRAAGFFNMGMFIKTSSPTTKINSAIALTTADYGYVSTATLTGGSTTSFNIDAAATNIIAGTKILILQTQDYANANSAGTYEEATVLSKSTNTITLTAAVTKTYYSGLSNQVSAQSTQVIKILDYTKKLAIVNGGSITAYAWDGTKGGVVAITSTKSITLSGTGTITALGAGFRGSTTNSAQGESWTGLGTALTTPNGGAGGGGTISSQTAAAASYATSGVHGVSSLYNVPGLIYGDEILTKLHLGSAGGSALTASTVASSVGRIGGGAIYITAASLTVSGTGGITANAADAATLSGGGSGGSIKITTTGAVTAGSELITATGTVGGSAASTTSTGGLGRIYFSAGGAITGHSNPQQYSSSGALTVSSNMVVNAYAAVTSPPSPSTEVVVDNADNFLGGDQVLVLQTQDYNHGTTGSGTYEYATISTVNRTTKTITFTASLDNTYYIGTGDTANAQSVQLVKVPKYSGITVASGASILGSPWDGKKGGVIALDATAGTITVTGTINATGIGFRGFSPAVAGATAGESWTGLGPVSTTTLTANGGGGGGANSRAAASGGYGGAGIDGATAGFITIGGAVYGDAPLAKLNLGSAGGMGHGSLGARAGWGGGAIITSNVATLTLTGTISADGGDCGTTTAASGSGGSIKIITTNAVAVGTSKITAVGGNNGSDGGVGRIALTPTKASGTTSPANN